MKKGVAISVIIVLIVILILLVYAYNSNKQYQEDKKSFSNFITDTKCLSLCPVIEFNKTPTESMSYFFDTNCMHGCQKFSIINNMVNHSTIPSGSKLEKRYNDYGQQFIVCYNKMREDKNSDYQNCFNNAFESVKDIKDLSNFKLPEYTRYHLDILDLNCEANSANVTSIITNSDDDLIGVSYLLHFKSGSTFVAGSLNDSKINVVTSYILGYPEGVVSYGPLESVGIAMQTKYGNLPEQSKACIN